MYGLVTDEPMGLSQLTVQRVVRIGEHVHLTSREALTCVPGADIDDRRAHRPGQRIERTPHWSRPEYRGPAAFTFGHGGPTNRGRAPRGRRLSGPEKAAITARMRRYWAERRQNAPHGHD